MNRPARVVTSGRVTGRASGRASGAARLGAMLAGVACATCNDGGTDVGNPLIDIGIDAYHLTHVAAATPRPSGGVTAAAAGDRTVDGVWVVLDKVELREAASCEASAELTVSGPIVVDAIHAVVPDALKSLRPTGGGYCRIELTWHPATPTLPPGAPAELMTSSIVVTGTRGDGARFVIATERGDGLKLRARGDGFTIGAATTTLFVGFDMDRWLAGIDLDAVPLDAGVARVDRTHATAALETFDKNVAAAAKLFEDRDNDGRLGDGEDRDSDALADGDAP